MLHKLLKKKNKKKKKNISVFSICIYSKSRKYKTVGHGVFCPEASNVICYDLHTITRLSSGCRTLHSECKAI